MADNFQFKNQYPTYHIHNLKARMFWLLSAIIAFTVLETLYRNLKKITQRIPGKPLSRTSKKRYSYWVKVFSSLYKTPLCRNDQTRHAIVPWRPSKSNPVTIRTLIMGTDVTSGASLGILGGCNNYYYKVSSTRKWRKGILLIWKYSGTCRQS